MMDPLSFGMVLAGSLGGTFIILTALDKKGYSINANAVKLAVETAKYGTLLYLLYKVFTLFI